MILEGATISEIEQSNPHFKAILDGADIEATVELYSLLEYFDISPDSIYEKDLSLKVQRIIEFAKETGRTPLEIAMDYNAQKGNNGQSILDKVYSSVRIDQEISRTTNNLQGLYKQKYENSNPI